MGNNLTFKKRFPNPNDYISMSNGLTSAFLNSVIMSGSRLASTNNQKLLMVFIGTKNQRYVGIGTVGFDILDLPWNQNTFEQDKSYMINTLKKAKQYFGWSSIDDYPYNSGMVFPCLDKFIKIIEQLEQEDIDDTIYDIWMNDNDLDGPVKQGFPQCDIHQVYLSVFGCLLCTD